MKENIWIHSLSSHKDIKDLLLNEIESSWGENITGDNDVHQTFDKDVITKTDFFQRKEKFYSNSYITILHSEFQKEFYKILMRRYCVENFYLDYAWYQQYRRGDVHQWHFHPTSNLSFVYFLELSSHEESTEFFDVEKEKPFQLNVKEGDVLVFPSFTPHRSPEIETENRKTIISGNINLRYVNFETINSSN